MRKDCTGNKLSDVKVNYITNNLCGDQILDVGAGYCYYSEWLAASKPNLKVVAVDRLDLVNVHGVEFICADLEQPIPLPSESFSTVLAFDIIEHITKEELLISELYRLCKSNGVLIGSVPHDDDKFLPAYNLTFYHRSDVTHKRYYIPASVRHVLELAGFTAVVVDLKGGVSPQVIAEFFPENMHFFIKRAVGLLRRVGIINTRKLSSDLFFIARKN